MENKRLERVLACAVKLVNERAKALEAKRNISQFNGELELNGDSYCEVRITRDIGCHRNFNHVSEYCPTCQERNKLWVVLKTANKQKAGAMRALTVAVNKLSFPPNPQEAKDE